MEGLIDLQPVAGLADELELNEDLSRALVDSARS
jgi:hypothetical protein